MGEEIVNRIFELMKKNNITQVQLATYLNIKQGTVAGWKQRNCPPPIEQIIKIAELLNTSIEYIAIGKTNKTSINTELTPEEEKLLKCYRTANDHDKKTIITIAELQAQELISSTSKIG